MRCARKASPSARCQMSARRGQGRSCGKGRSSQPSRQWMALRTIPVAWLRSYFKELIQLYNARQCYAMLCMRSVDLGFRCLAAQDST